ncbi:MAG: LTA synthase family protein [Clostridiales bacterium]|nr:LTA synthase family protein [Clostridiales bacterium]
MNGRRKFLIGLLAAIALLDLAGTAWALRRYPQRIVSRDALFGENQMNLNEFETDGEGILTAQSDDPWIYYILEQPMNIQRITVKTSHVSGPETRAQFYLMPSLSMKETPLTDGAVRVRFGYRDGKTGVSAIRLDMATDEGASVLVEKAVINSRIGIFWDCQRVLLIVLALAGLAAAETAGWVRLARNRKHRYGYLFIFLVQAGAKLAILWLLRDYLLHGAEQGSLYLLSWMFALGLELFCAGTVWVGAGPYRRNIWFSYALAVPFAVVWFSATELLCLVAFTFQSPGCLALNLLFIWLAAAILLLILRRGAPAFSIVAAALTILIIVNHYYSILRENPLEYFDIALARTAAGVVSHYTFAIDRETASVLCALVTVILTAFASLGIKGCESRRATCAANLALTAAAAVLLRLQVPIIENFANLQIISSEKGYLLSFLSFIRMGRITKPDGYSPNAVQQILEHDAQNTAKKHTPNIIVIMDEAFADLPDIYGFLTTEDVLPNIHAMSENTVHGSLLTSVYGGGTANTEYEFLTGNSLHYFPVGCSPYVQYVSSSQQSLAWRLEHLGYESAAYHPYLAISYRREEAYPLLGLDPFYTIDDDLPHEEYIRSYISDQADFDNIIDLYERRDPDRPFFLFNVTMQNHGGFATEDYGLDLHIRPIDSRLQDEGMLEYLYLIHETDSAFASLVEYFSQVEEDTVILLFGDHQPSMEQDVIDAMGQIVLDLEGVEDDQRYYYSTFVMWANYDMEEKRDVLSSPNYLRALLLETAGVETNPFERFLLRMSQEYPAINAYGYLDAEGEWHYRSDEEEGLLKDYHFLVYHNVFDKKNMNPAFFE